MSETEKSNEDETTVLAEKTQNCVIDEEQEPQEAAAVIKKPIVRTKAVASSGEGENRQCQLPISRIKNIMKLDSELGLVSKESLFLVTKATEIFIDFLSKETYKYTCQSSRKTIQKKDIDQAINSVDSLIFLDAALD